MKILALCAAAAVLAAPFAAAANEVTEVVKTTARGLDLSTERDAGVMLQRLDRAALRACGASAFSLREVREATRASACYSDGMSSAVASLGAPTVRALYAQHAAVRLAAN